MYIKTGAHPCQTIDQISWRQFGVLFQWWKSEAILK